MHSATRQNAGSRASDAYSRNWTGRGTARGARRLSRARRNTAPGSPPRSARRCRGRLRASAARAARFPAAPSPRSRPACREAKAMPFMVARRSGGYQSANAENEDIRQPETPSPMSARASVSSGGGPRERKPQAARRRDQQQRCVHAPRPVAVEQHAQRQLEQREGEEVDAGEQPQARRRERELAREVRPDDRVDRAVDVGDEIPREERQGDAPEKTNN